jgi:predicted peptidase
MRRSLVRHLLSALLLASALVSSPATSAEQEAPSTATAPSGQHAHRFEKTIEKRLATNYLLYLPASYGMDDRRWPLLVYLHGGGGSGTEIDRLARYPLVERLEREVDFPFVVVSPQCPPGRLTGHGPMGETWSEHAELVDRLIEELLGTYRLDPDRVVLVGHSMGGYGAWYLAHRYPERFAAVAPMSAPGVTWWTYRAKETPFWVFHGEDDQVVPIAESEAMIEAVKEIGGSVRFTRYLGNGHAIRQPFEEDELFDWLLEQRRRHDEGAAHPTHAPEDGSAGGPQQ